MRNISPRFRARPQTLCLELVLRLEDGSPWRLTVSAGMERFIGCYPRVEGLDADGPLLRFQPAGPA
ncbi:MAG TPA: hypothetical protein VK403_09865 [Allosphingosinicella sp.]|nr:hypothetical protein [Allosphingosinicella sp.]